MRENSRQTLRWVVAIDGPAGSGKTTVARRVARRLSYTLVDTGALYRCLALLARQRNIADTDAEALGVLARGMQVRFEEAEKAQRVFLFEEEVTDAIRTPEISQGASRVSALPPVRDALLGLQRDLARQGAAVMEGRDIGTVVYPAAQLKIFLDASLETRAKRRTEELRAKGHVADFAQTLAEVKERDARDRSRDVAPLCAAADALVLDTSALSIDEVVALVIKEFHRRAAS